MDLSEYTAELEEANLIYSEAIKDPTIQEYMNLRPAEENMSNTRQEQVFNKQQSRLARQQLKKMKRGIKL